MKLNSSVKLYEDRRQDIASEQEDVSENYVESPRSWELVATTPKSQTPTEGQDFPPVKTSCGRRVTKRMIHDL